MSQFKYGIFLFVCWMYSCGQAVSSNNDKCLENTASAFPVAIFTFDYEKYENVFLDKRSDSWREYSHFQILKIGKVQDTVVIDKIINDITPQPRLPGQDSSEYESLLWQQKELAPMAEYFLEWDESHTYKFWNYSKMEINVDTSLKYGNSYMLKIDNPSIDTVVAGYGNVLPIAVEARDSSGNWREIEKVLKHNCGVGISSFILPPDESIITMAPVFDGDYITDIRYRYGENVSNSYKAKIKYRQFLSIFDDNGNYRQEYLDEKK